MEILKNINKIMLYKVKSKCGRKKEIDAINENDLNAQIVDRFDFSVKQETVSFPCAFQGQAQRDSRWAKKTMGDSNSTIGDYGCTISSISSLGFWACDDKTPDWCADNFRFTANGSLYWDSVTNADINMDFVYRYYGDNPAKIKEILNSELNTVVLEVPAWGAKHWVAGLSYSNGDYLVYDPWYNDTVYLKQRYGKCTGFAEFTSKK